VKTEIVAAADDRRRRSQTAATERAVELLRQGQVVAVPTETVYGLAADALRAEAVIRIFEAKERPKFDPLIVHLPDRTWLERVAKIDTINKEIVFELIDVFWPGPFTIVLPKTDLVPDLVTAGLDTVAARISAHPVFHAIISEFGQPLAAPSANRFGRISPTTAQHVFDELEGRISMIVDGGPTIYGVESTIVIVDQGQIQILRPGPITDEDLRGIGLRPLDDRPAADATIVRAPGQLPSHYAPKTPLRLVASVETFSSAKNQRIGLLGWNHPKFPEKFTTVCLLTERHDLREAAANLFRHLRELDKVGLDLIVAEQVPEKGLGIAINDRLKRAAKDL
jgi:L-threonylcarbamoyladenylate synthase